MKRIGNQEPTIHFSLPYSQTEGQDAIDLYELTGRNALEWQQILVKDILAKNDKGLWTHTRFGYSVPRQNGKGEILAIIELYALAVGLRVLHTVVHPSEFALPFRKKLFRFPFIFSFNSGIKVYKNSCHQYIIVIFSHNIAPYNIIHFFCFLITCFSNSSDNFKLYLST